MKRVFLGSVSAIVLLALAAAGFAVWNYQTELQSILIQKFPKKTKMLVLYGNVDDRQVNLAFQIPERIKEILVEEGASVKAGDLLANLETVRIENQIKAAKANLDSAQVHLEKLLNGSRKEDIEIAKAELKAAQAKRKAAINDFERQKFLVKTSSVSIQIMEAAEAQFFLYDAACMAAESNLKKLKAGPRTEDIAAARTQLEQAKVQLAIQMQNQKDTALYAPCDGIIRNKVMEPGEMANAQTPVLILAKISPKWIRTYLPETVLNSIVQGEKAIVRFDSNPGVDFEGWVGFISPNAEFTPKNIETPELRTSLVYEARIFVKDPDNRLKLGAPATILFPGTVVK